MEDYISTSLEMHADDESRVRQNGTHIKFYTYLKITPIHSTANITNIDNPLLML